MRILIVHHGTRPTLDQPVTGGALRASGMAEALEADGHLVRLLSRQQDEPGGFTSEEDLYQRARDWGPDRIIATQIEDAPALGAVGAPIAVDLYAPRVLEAAFEGTLRNTSVATLRALAAGDVFLVSNPRQRWFWMGILAMAGIDVRADPTLLVPLLAPQGPRRRTPKAPVFVAGGGSWPWQNPVPALERVLEHLDRRGEGRVVWYGGVPEGAEASWTLPTHSRLKAAGWVDRPTLLRAYAGATAALDWMTANPERELAFRFRHADYLGCGLPILTFPNSPLADVLGSAGWASHNIEATLDAVLDDADELARRAKAARRYARTSLSPARAFAPLMEWIATGARHAHSPTDLVDRAQLAADAARAHESAAAATEAQTRAEAEVVRKRAEVDALNGQIRTLMRSMDRMTRAMDEVAGFKREAIQLLGNQSTADRLSLDSAVAENALLRADVEKKSAEIRAMDELRARLENDVENLRKELKALQGRSRFRR
ncbi:MAG: hypothetical protein VX944_00095 [Myxococcota bacterium]|nr:hypothetical protein [Myxococcota bacterium]MEC9388451.1 hypothetical protein [Myxococcota bacterium]